MDYKQVFIRRELNSFLGEKNRNLWISTLLLSIAMVTISWSLGSYYQLKERMDNPFTNYVTMPELAGYAKQMPEMRKYFDNPENLSAYGLESITGFVKNGFWIINPKTFKKLNPTGRTLNFGDELSKKIFEKSNIVDIKENFDFTSPDNRFELFISEDFCKELGLSPKSVVGKNILLEDFESDSKFTFKIGAVLKVLPNHTDLVVSNAFYNVFKKDYSSSGFVAVNAQTSMTLISDKPIKRKKIEQLLGTNSLIDLESAELEWVGDLPLYQTKIFTTDFILEEDAEKIYQDLSEGYQVCYIQRIWTPVKGFDELERAMYISFNFNPNELDKIKELNTFLKEKFKMEIELTVVEERDNFSMVSRMTFITILSLIVISLISFSIFLFNLIRNHLDKIKPNIGTFMAFGFSSSDISNIYESTVMQFLLRSWIMVAITIFLCWLLGKTTGLGEFVLLHPVTISTVISFNVLAYIMTKVVTRKLMKETPGDLIYNRV